MSTAAQTSSGVAVEKPIATRLASIDIFRGLTMMVMIFVNDLSSVHGLPWWTYHAAAKIDAMTYVDMVYPFFLFAIGLSIPLSIKARLKKNPSIPALWLHVLLRSISLIVLGLILANAEKGDAALMHISGNVWALLALAGGVMFWLVPSGSERHLMLYRTLRIVGLILMVVMFAIFRRTTHDGHIAWIDGSYPEILGLIGYTYLAISILYIPTRRWVWAPAGWLVALVAFNSFCIAKWIVLPRHLPLYFWPFDNGAMASIVMGGIVTSVIFLGAHKWQTLQKKLLLALSFAVVSLAAGYVLIPLGISKIRATPTWALFCIGAAVLLFMALYWICDVKKNTSWAAFVHPAGANTLLTYLLPDFFYFIVGVAGITYLDTHFNVGLPGIIRAVVFTAVILGISAALTKWKIRLQL